MPVSVNLGGDISIMDKNQFLIIFNYTGQMGTFQVMYYLLDDMLDVFLY